MSLYWKERTKISRSHGYSAGFTRNTGLHHQFQQVSVIQTAYCVPWDIYIYIYQLIQSDTVPVNRVSARVLSSLSNYFCGLHFAKQVSMNIINASSAKNLKFQKQLSCSMSQISYWVFTDTLFVAFEWPLLVIALNYSLLLLILHKLPGYTTTRVWLNTFISPGASREATNPGQVRIKSLPTSPVELHM